MPTVKFYEGKKGVHQILDDVLDSMILNEEKEYYVYSAAGITTDLYQGFEDFSKRRIKNKIKVKTISFAQAGELRGLDERKYLETEEDQQKTYIIIYADKCAYISRDAKGQPVGVIIANSMIYQTQKIIFKQLWQFLK